jgi:hypothetical protein
MRLREFSLFESDDIFKSAAIMLLLRSRSKGWPCKVFS